MFIIPSLFITKEKNIEADPEVQMIYYDHTLTLEFQSIVNRPISTIFICEKGGKRFQVRALWDTGASTSCVSEKIANKAGFRPVDSGTGVTAIESKDIVFCMLDVHISDDIIIPNVKVAEFSLKHHDIDFLIGMDIISKGNLQITNKDGKTKIEFERKDLKK